MKMGQIYGPMNTCVSGSILNWMILLPSINFLSAPHQSFWKKKIRKKNSGIEADECLLKK